jgi:hypothetical protein
MVMKQQVKTRKFLGNRVGLLKLRPTKAVFDPETKAIYTWTTPNLHHAGVIDTFSNKNIGHLLVHSLDRVIEIEYPSDAPKLLKDFLRNGGQRSEWYNYYCKHAKPLFTKDVKLITSLYPNWKVKTRMPKV